MTSMGVANVLGINRTKWELHAMVRALKIHPWMNSHDEERRLQAAKWALRHWGAYQDECRRQRENRG